MEAEFYRNIKRLLLAGESPLLESALAPDSLGRERLTWRGGVLGELPEGPCYAQTLSAPVRLVICGGGHVAQALVPAARSVGFQTTVLENRPDMLAEGDFPEGTDLRCGAFEQLLRDGEFGANAFYAIMTRGHQEDWSCLTAILKLPRGYVGMIGSRKKAAATRQMLRQAGFGPEEIDSVHTPIGLDIGAETPAEIAVSIAAQLIRCRRELGLEAPLESGLIEALDHPPFALVTLVACQGSTPRGPGARMLVFPDGTIRGTIGGGVSEAAAKRQAREALETGEAGLHAYRMDGSAGSVCGGTAQYLIIPVKGESLTC